MNAQRNRTPVEPQLGSGRQFAPEMEAALEGLAETLQHLRRDPPARNDATFEQPALFYALGLRHAGMDNLGRDWAQPILPHYGERFARIKDQLSGISGLTELMYADFQSRQDSDPKEQFSESLRERLFLALMELTAAANHNMEVVGDAVNDYAQQVARGSVVR